MLTLLIAFISLIILMIVHEFGHFIIAKKFGVKVEEFGIFLPPRIFAKKFGDTVYSFNLIPFGAFVKIHGEEGQDNEEKKDNFNNQEGEVYGYRSFTNLKIWKRILIVLGGVLAFWIAAIVIFSMVFGIGASVPVGDQDITGINNIKIKIVSVIKDSPAEKAGLKNGDEILGFNKVSDFQSFIAENKGNEVFLNIKREESEVKLALTPRVSYPEGQGPTGLVLERIASLIEKHPWYQAPLKGTIYTGKITLEALNGIYKFFASIFKGDGLPQGAALAGPIGITIFLSRAVEYGPGFFLYFIGSLTVLLAIFNLFPIPALDGGKIVFLIIEKIIKKPVPAKLEKSITALFFALLIIMSIFITIKFDIPRVMDLWKAGL